MEYNICGVSEPTIWGIRGTWPIQTIDYGGKESMYKIECRMIKKCQECSCRQTYFQDATHWIHICRKVGKIIFSYDMARTTEPTFPDFCPLGDYNPDKGWSVSQEIKKWQNRLGG